MMYQTKTTFKSTEKAKRKSIICRYLVPFFGFSSPANILSKVVFPIPFDFTNTILVLIVYYVTPEKIRKLYFGGKRRENFL